MKKTTIIAMMLFLSIALSIMTVLGNANPIVTTDKEDYAPGEIVTINGSGFGSGETYAVPVIRPDGSVVIVNPDHTFSDGWGFATSNDVGEFTYLYQLDGVEGSYIVNVYPSSWEGDLAETPIASVTFTDTPPVTPAKLKIDTFTTSSNYTETFPWAIDKSVTPDTWNLFKGDSGTSNYTVTLTKEAGVYHAWFNGSISVTNSGDLDTVGLAIVVNVTDGVPPPDDLVSTVNVDLSSNPTLSGDETGTYLYSIDVPLANVHTGPSANYKVNAYATAIGSDSNDSDTNTFADPFGALILINDVVHVEDTNGGSWAFSDSGKVSYLKTFTAPDDAGTHDNTATITETGQHDSASVTVNSYALVVEKDATPLWNRTYSWTIEKSANISSATLAIGGTTGAKYNVTVNATYADSYAVSGEINITNPAPITANITSISDVVTTDITASITDLPEFPYIIAADDTLTLHYTTYLPDNSARTNNATAIIQNYNYNSSVIGTLSGTTGFSGTADVDFTGVTPNEINKTVDVSDTLQGTLGSLTYGTDTLPYSYIYERTIGPYGTADTYYVDNTASVKVDSTTLASANWEITVYVEGSSFCAVTSKGFQDIDTFKLIFTPDVPDNPGYSRLTASNPGQFSFNVFLGPSAGETVSLTIPYPFVTQGANPVHIYTDVSGYNPSGSDITGLFDLTTSGIPITLTSYTGTRTFGDTAMISFDVPSSYTGSLYITIHLDYGLKKVAGGYSKDLDLNATANVGISAYDSIENDQLYTFSVAAPFIGSDSINNLNVFKNDPGIGGLVLDEFGTPVANAKVEVFQGKNSYGTAYTDEDGWYMVNFKYTGKPTTFTIKVYGYPDQSVTIKSNSFTVVTFDLSPAAENTETTIQEPPTSPTSPPGKGKK